LIYNILDLSYQMISTFLCWRQIRAHIRRTELSLLQTCCWCFQAWSDIEMFFNTRRPVLTWSNLWTKPNFLLLLIFIFLKISFNRKLSFNICFILIHWWICSILIYFYIHDFRIYLNMFSDLFFAQAI
jgi:hypothetical protein